MITRNTKAEISVKDLQSHILHYMFRKKSAVQEGDLRAMTMGMTANYDEVKDALLKANYIVMEDKLVSLSQEGRNFMQEQETLEKKRIQRLVFENEPELAMLEFLHFRDGLVAVEDIPTVLKDHVEGSGINDGPVEDFLFHLAQKGYVVSPYVRWYGITSTGSDYYEHHLRKFNLIHGGTAAGSAGSFGPGFSASEIRDINSKIDTLLDRLESMATNNNQHYAAMRADFEEMKNMYNLGKKHWGQLMVGKLTEWVAAGVVSETVSKQIVEFVKGITQKLLGF